MTTTKTLRDRLRISHLGEGTVLAAYIYSPLGDMAGPRAFIRFVLLPAMVVSGVVMWRLPALRSRLHARRSTAGAT